MKSFRIYQEDALSHDNLERAFLKPSLGKRDRKDVRKVLDNLEQEIENLRSILQEGRFKPSRHESVTINEGSYMKKRTIIKPYYKYEQVVHHVVIQAMKPGIDKGMYEYVIGSIPKRGPHYGKKRIVRWIKNDIQNTKYVLKVDIRHFFQSIDHESLKKWIRKKFKGQFILDLTDIIIEATEEGLPLGYYTSQWFANFILQPLDHYLKEVMKVKYMTRYVDDIVCFGRNKKELHKVKRAMDAYLWDNFKLKLKGNWQVFRFEYEQDEIMIECDSLKHLEQFGQELERARIKFKNKMFQKKRRIFIPVKTARNKMDILARLLERYNGISKVVKMTHGRPLDYMGFEFHRAKTIMRESIMIRLTKKARQVSRQEKINPKDAQSILSRMGALKHTDTYKMYLERIKPIINTKKLKKIVSKQSRRRNDANSNLSKKRRQSGDKADRNRQNIEPVHGVPKTEHRESDEKNRVRRS